MQGHDAAFKAAQSGAVQIDHESELGKYSHTVDVPPFDWVSSGADSRLCH
jgi:hypothetical protein